MAGRVSEAGGAGRAQPGWRLSSVANAARLLKEFSREDRELGVSELSRRLGLATSTVHRLLATLADERLLERGSSPGGYRLGLALFDLGASAVRGEGLVEAALPVMATLRASTGETVQLAVLDGLESVYVDRLESPHTVRIFSRVGTRLPATTTSTGKVLLAALPPDDLDARLAGWTPQRVTPHTIVDESTLRSRLAEIAERGWAENLEESRVGVVSVGAP
ncbi:MAG: IclR family transcriptional regulator, partial [Actinomycetota bacterium]|nr:IclR family transcriptional regulator [Actinomycetota bacterium]